MTGLGFAFLHWHKAFRSDPGFCFCSEPRLPGFRHWRSPGCGVEFLKLQKSISVWLLTQQK